MTDDPASELDVRLLRVLVAVVETRSVSRAAERLDLTQSAVSHALARLRRIVGEPLVVKSGRGIATTARAAALAVRAQALLDEIRRFSESGRFTPARWNAELTIAANDLQRDLLLPPLLDLLRREAPGVRLRVIPSDAPTAELLRSDDCHLVISPRPPEGADIVQRRLFQDRWRVFHDPAMRAAPASRAEYLAAEHVSVGYAPPRSLAIDGLLADRGVRRRIVAWVPNFSGIASFVRGSARVATMPGLLRQGILRDLADSAVPVPCPPMPMYLIWHERHRSDPAHRWLRSQLVANVPPELGAGAHTASRAA